MIVVNPTVTISDARHLPLAGPIVDRLLHELPTWQLALHLDVSPGDPGAFYDRDRVHRITIKVGYPCLGEPVQAVYYSTMTPDDVKQLCTGLRHELAEAVTGQLSRLGELADDLRLLDDVRASI